MFYCKTFHRLVKSWRIRPPIGNKATVHHFDAQEMHVVV